MGMRIETSRPTYPLNEAKRLAREGSFTVNAKPRNFIKNHVSFDYETVIAELFDVLDESMFYKSEAMNVLDGKFADIYRDVPYDNADWYIKFFIADGNVQLTVMSCKWDGIND